MRALVSKSFIHPRFALKNYPSSERNIHFPFCLLVFPSKKLLSYSQLPFFSELWLFSGLLHRQKLFLFGVIGGGEVVSAILNSRAEWKFGDARERHYTPKFSSAATFSTSLSSPISFSAFQQSEKFCFFLGYVARIHLNATSCLCGHGDAKKNVGRVI